ncbi:MAG TPA: gamma-glutamyltransferase family protein [Stellaceae bacterium]|jgi:gamma-glutamyltranspeptidase/glutathione hydrolase|nr:gamma-glutamyltransferase family protein [Stellaceae bacterium]
MPPFTTRPEIRGTFGVVASTHWLASSVGMSILERGGNAFDAAVAAGFALQVVEPHLNGPFGDAPILVWDHKARQARMICGQGPAPQGATIAHYRGLGLDLVPGTGLLAAVVPGAFDAWTRMLRDYGTMPLSDILAPALGYAENGYPLVFQACNTIATVAEMFRKEWPTSAALYLPNGAPPVPGKLFRNPGLAATYKRVLAESEAGGGSREQRIDRARNAWYRGFVAAATEAFCKKDPIFDSSGRRHYGVLTADDMARWQAPVETPVSYDYHGYTVLKGGAWSQGPVLLQQLALLSGFDLDDTDPTGPEFVHVVVECAKLAYADREAWYGDPDFTDVPMATLLSPAYNDARRKLIDDRASLELRPGNPDGRRPYVPAPGKQVAAMAGIGEPTVGALAGIGEPTISPLGAVAGDTCHLDIIDRWGNMVSATPSGGWLQSSPLIPALGFCLGSRLQISWLDQNTASSLEPGKRPRSTLSPTLALKDGEPSMAFGTPGGDGQDQWSTQLFLHHVHHGMNLQEAIDCPEFNTAHAPSSFYPRAAEPGSLTVEGRMPEATRRALAAKGHRVSVGEQWSGGRLTACAREETDEGVILKAGANPRGMQTYAVGR